MHRLPLAKQLTPRPLSYIVLLDSLQQQAFYIGRKNVAAKAKKSTPSTSKAPKTATTVTRIKASEAKPSKKATTKVAATNKTRAKAATPRPVMAYLKPFIAIGEYLKGAWYELRQVRWPNRKATWGLTAAVLIFSAFFVVLIVLLDVVFKFLFELILK